MVQSRTSQILLKPIVALCAVICFITLWSLQSSLDTTPSRIIDGMHGRIHPNEVAEVKGNSTMAISGIGGESSEVENRIVHVVMFEFRSDAKKEEVDSHIKAMLGLKDNCLHPTTQKPYLKSMIGGKQNSPEGMHQNTTHVFIAEFLNEEDRKYYLENDPAHSAFVKSVGGVLEKAIVVDFNPGIF